MKTKLYLIAIVFLTASISAQSQGPDTEINTSSLDEAVDVYNSNTDRLPSFTSSLVGDQRINIYLEDRNLSIEMDGIKISELDQSSLEDPTLEVYVERNQLEDIRNSEQPLKALNTKLKEGNIDYETHGTVNSAKFFIFEKLLGLGSLF